jgi:hypothetical protein
LEKFCFYNTHPPPAAPVESSTIAQSMTITMLGQTLTATTPSRDSLGSVTIRFDGQDNGGRGSVGEEEHDAVQVNPPDDHVHGFVGYPLPRMIGGDLVFSLHWCRSAGLLDVPAVPVIGDDLDGALGGALGHEGRRRVVEPDVGGPQFGAAKRPGGERRRRWLDV